MNKTITGTYDSADKIQNVKDDLVATGIPQEKIFVDGKTDQIKIIVPVATKREIMEILNRHNPTSVVSRDTD